MMPGAACERGKNSGSLRLCCYVLFSGTLEEVVIMSSQKNKFLFFLLIGLFLSVCLALLHIAQEMNIDLSTYNG